MLQKDAGDGATLVVAHNGLGQAMLCTALGAGAEHFREHEFPNGGAVEIEWPQGAPAATRWRWCLPVRSPWQEVP